MCDSSLCARQEIILHVDCVPFWDAAHLHWDAAPTDFRSLRPKRKTRSYAEKIRGKMKGCKKQSCSAFVFSSALPSTLLFPVSRYLPCPPPCSHCSTLRPASLPFCPIISRPAPYPALPCLAVPCLSLPCLSLPCLLCRALPCHAVPYPALPCPVLSCPALPYPDRPSPMLFLPCIALPSPEFPCSALTVPCRSVPCPVVSCPTLPCLALLC